MASHEGRARAIAALIRMHGPARAAALVKAANAQHQALNPGGCSTRHCPVCEPTRDEERAG